MKKSKSLRSKIAYAPAPGPRAPPPRDVCRQLGGSEPPSTLEEEIRPFGRQRAAEAAITRGRNGRLKRLVADLTLDKHILAEALRKKGLRPARRREGWPGGFRPPFHIGVRRACHLAQSAGRRGIAADATPDQAPLRLRIRELAHARRGFGYQRIWVCLRREGWRVNRKNACGELYRLEGLQVRMRMRRRKHMALHRGPGAVRWGPTERWSIDFVHNALSAWRPVSRAHRRRSVEVARVRSWSGRRHPRGRPGR